MEKIIKIKAFPGSRKEKIEEVSDNSFKIYLKEKPEQGKANKKMLEILANYLGLSETALRITKGAKSRNKYIEIKS